MGKYLRTNVKTEPPSPRYVQSQQDSVSTPNIVRHEKQQHNIPQQQTSPLPLTNGNKPQQILSHLKSHSQQQQNQQRSLSEISGKASTLSIPPAHQLSMSDVSDMLLEFYKANAAKAPKNNKIDKFPRQASPSSADGATSIITSTPTITITPTKIRPTFSNGSESSTPIHTSTIIEKLTTAVVSKNLNGDEMVAKKSNETHQFQSPHHQSEENCSSSSIIANAVTKDIKKLNAPFHPRIKYSSVNNKSPISGQLTTIIQPLMSENVPPTSTAISIANTSLTSSSTGLPQSSVVVVPSSVIQSPILPSAPAAAALAAALFRDGYQNFHHQIRAQEQLLKQRQQDQQSQQSNVQQQQTVGSSNGLKNDCGNPNNGSNRIEERRLSGPPQLPPKYMQNFLMKKDQYSDNEQSSSDEREDDDEDEGKYPEIDDIHLIEGSKSGFNTSNQLSVSMDATDYLSDETHHKYSMIAAHALRNLEYTLNDYGNSGSGGHHRSSSGNSNAGADNMSNSNSDCGNNSILSKYEVGPNGEVEAMYNCRHCGKKYRWKSTLRRHENVECGGKEPSHQCPYCPYKSKQRGNLGVHVRKHHANLPQLASKRRSKYSQPRD
ncbi:longitudinals lacking protein [Condylostylus longicornis]|uniref:longitudinals lacking protein n=1 Tax=Condylostylus longicornis TaxID=2530218 RepID=UPI00244E0F72|nr:longitudinals lacking protein [Condylostylus longicornis]